MAGRALRASPHLKRDAFLAAFAVNGTITHAATAAGCTRDAHYAWMRNDPDYPALFLAALDHANDALEREARRRAVEGYEKPVYQGGKRVGTITEFSDTLLIFLMKGALPSKYRERLEVTFAAKDEAERVASALGVSVEEVLAEADRILAASR